MPSAVRIVPFEARHAAALCLRPEAQALLARLGPMPELARTYAAAGPAWTLLAQGWPLACGGAVRFWPGVGELWCWAGVEAASFGVPFARLAREQVRELFCAHGFHRTQAHVREDDDRAQRFARFLGLELEGRCPGYGPDKATYQIYGRFTSWKE
jgi:hypothetical protein